MQLLTGCEYFPSDARRLCVEVACAILKACYLGFETVIQSLFVRPGVARSIVPTLSICSVSRTQWTRQGICALTMLLSVDCDTLAPVRAAALSLSNRALSLGSMTDLAKIVWSLLPAASGSKRQ